MINILVKILILNLATHIVITFINYWKIESNEPIPFKLFYYFLLLNFNIMGSTILFFVMDIISKNLIGSYATITLSLFIMHFILDEDWIFRFEKMLNLIIMMFINVIFYGVWFVLMF